MNPTVVKTLAQARDVRVMRIQPGDVVVLKTAAPIDNRTEQALRNALHRHLGFPVLLIVLSADDDLSVVRPKKEAA